MPAFEGVAWSVSFISLAVSDCAASLDIQAAPRMDCRGMQGSKVWRQLGMAWMNWWSTWINSNFLVYLVYLVLLYTVTSVILLGWSNKCLPSIASAIIVATWFEFEWITVVETGLPHDHRKLRWAQDSEWAFGLYLIWVPCFAWYVLQLVWVFHVLLTTQICRLSAATYFFAMWLHSVMGSHIAHAIHSIPTADWGMFCWPHVALGILLVFVFRHQ